MEKIDQLLLEFVGGVNELSEFLIKFKINKNRAILNNFVTELIINRAFK